MGIQWQQRSESADSPFAVIEGQITSEINAPIKRNVNIRSIAAGLSWIMLYEELNVA